MAVLTATKALFLILSTIHLTSAYIIDQQCGRTGKYYGAVLDAIEEAVAIADYSAARMSQDRNRLDPFLKQMLGNNDGAADVYMGERNLLEGILTQC